MRRLLFLILQFASFSCIAQSDSIAQRDSTHRSFSVSAFLEVYYAYDFGRPDDHHRPSFIYNYNRHQEVNLNMGFIKAAYQTEKLRATLALMTGTYVNANLAAEPGVLQNIYESYVGVKISRTKDIWIDAGIFSSHLGFESPVGNDNLTLTRSLVAECSPYYEAGAKLSYTSPDSKWFLSALVLNGWQHIQRPDGYSTPAFGHQVIYTPHSKLKVNSSSFIGSDTPDSTRQMRYFHDLYAQFECTDRFKLITGFDIGAQQRAKGSSEYDMWYAPVLIASYELTKKLSTTARVEYYYDPEQVIVLTETEDGFQTIGYSLNLDYKIADNVLFRLEGRAFSSKDEVFFLDDVQSSTNYAVTTSLAITF